MSGPENNHLIDRIQKGDKNCFADIVAWYSHEIHQLCYALLWNQEEAEDMVQETYFRLVRSIKQGKIRTANGSIKGYLKQTARNLCIDQLRKRIPQESWQEHHEQQTGDSISTTRPDQIADHNRFQDAFDHALGQLNDIQRMVLVLHEFEELPHREIAVLLDSSIERIKTLLSRAKKNMRNQLEPFIQDYR